MCHCRPQIPEITHWQSCQNNLSAPYKPLFSYSLSIADTSFLDCSNRADDLRAFLEASAKGWTFAAEQPGPAAELLTQLANSEDGNLPQPLDAEMVQESQVFISPVRTVLLSAAKESVALASFSLKSGSSPIKSRRSLLLLPGLTLILSFMMPSLRYAARGCVQSVLDGSRRWGHMDAGRWRTFLQWLSESGLLTSKVMTVTLQHRQQALAKHVCIGLRRELNEAWLWHKHMPQS